MVGIISRKDLLPETIEAQFSENRGQYTPDGTLNTLADDALPVHSLTPSRSTGSLPGSALRLGNGNGQHGISHQGAQAGSGDREVALTVEGMTGRRTQSRHS